MLSHWRRTSRTLLFLLAAKVTPLTGNTAGIVGKTFCAKGLPSSTNDYDICCKRRRPRLTLEHWTYVLTKYNSRFGLRFLDLPATLALLDAKARGEVAVGV